MERFLFMCQSKTKKKSTKKLWALVKITITQLAGNSAKFEIADAKLHVPVVTLSTKDSVNLTKQLSEGFKRSVYWKNYQTKPAKVIEKDKNLYDLLNASLQGVRRLFVITYVVAAGVNDEASIKDNKKYFLPKGEIKKLQRFDW